MFIKKKNRALVVLFSSIALTTASLKCEVGCLRYPGASTIGSQLLDEDHSHGWQILATAAMSPHAEGKAGTHLTELTASRKREGREDVLPYKAMLSVNTIIASQSKGTCYPGACTYQKHC